VAQSFRSLILDQVGSTNREAFALAESGVAGPLWVMARRQSAGRGRADRQWVSAPGNLHASLLIELDCPPTAVPQLSLLAGVATFDAIRRAAAADGAPVPAGLRLKWPNDVLIGQAKCAGILVETSGAFPGRRGMASPVQGRRLDPSAPFGEGTPAPGSSLAITAITAVIGIGIDLAWHPTAMHRAATDLAAHGCRIAPEAMLEILDEAMQRWLGIWDNGRGFHSIRQGWLEGAGPVGEMCTVDTGRERIAGTFADLDPTGALIICDNHGRRRTVTFGDVALDRAPDWALAGPASKEAS
jgi:BirA family biotin operon repressor/biotin-[acetyl-CoA-carboxylase] ligase